MKLLYSVYMYYAYSSSVVLFDALLMHSDSPQNTNIGCH